MILDKRTRRETRLLVLCVLIPYIKICNSLSSHKVLFFEFILREFYSKNWCFYLMLLNTYIIMRSFET